MEWIHGIAFLLALLTSVVLYLMVWDVEIHKRVFRRYMKQLERDGAIHSKVTWGQMMYGWFILPAWFYRLPDPKKRPDVYMYPELVEVREKVRKNWRVVRWLVPMFLLFVLIAFWPLIQWPWTE